MAAADRRQVRWIGRRALATVAACDGHAVLLAMLILDVVQRQRGQVACAVSWPDAITADVAARSWPPAGLAPIVTIAADASRDAQSGVGADDSDPDLGRYRVRQLHRSQL